MMKSLMFILLIMSFSTAFAASYESPAFINMIEDANTEVRERPSSPSEQRTFEEYETSASCQSFVANKKLIKLAQQAGNPSFVVFYNRQLDDKIYEPKAQVTLSDGSGNQITMVEKISLPLNQTESSLTAQEIRDLEACATNYFNTNRLIQVDRNFLLRAAQINSDENQSVREIEIKSISQGADYLVEIVFSSAEDHKIKIIKLANGQVIYNQNNNQTTVKSFRKSNNHDFAKVKNTSPLLTQLPSSFESISQALISHWSSKKVNPIDAKDRIKKQQKALGINYSKKKNSGLNNSASRLGSGFFISRDGYLITNSHVVKNSDQISIKYKNIEYQAELIDEDTENDIALLKVGIIDAPFLNLNSAGIKKGNDICALGYPLVQLQGQEIKATFGHINSLTGFKNDPRFMQIDSAIQPGNSGGPLVDKKSDVVGIVTGKLDQANTYKSTGSFSQNVNYALKISYVLPLLEKNEIKLPKQNNKKLSNTELITKASKSVVLVKVN